MAKHEIKIHENTSPTREAAQYLGSYITKTTVSLAQLCKSAAELSGVPELKLQTLVENDIDAFIELERQGACRIHVDGGYVELRILGTFPAADSPWDPAKNSLVVAFTPDDEIRNHLVNVVPKIVTDETSTKVRVTNVFDVAEPKPTELIHGQNEYQMQGYNLCMDDVGAKVELVNALGVRFECTVVRVINRQNIVCRSNALLEPGDYKAVAYSRGGDPEGQLLNDWRKVKYLKVEPEPLVKSSDGFVKVKSIDENPIPTLEHFTIRGENVGYKSRDPDQGLPDHGLMGALATVAGQPLSWHCTAFDDEHAPEATFQSDGGAEELEPGEYTAALTLNYAVDDGTGVSHLEPLVIENVKFKVGE